MIEVRRIRAGEGPALRSLRLKALADAPEAFSTTLEQGLQLSDAVWEERADRGAESSATAYFLAVDGGRFCGMVGVYAPEGSRVEIELISLWVDPAHRRTGIARALIHAAENPDVGGPAMIVNPLCAKGFWCERGDLNPHGLRHTPLKLEACVSNPQALGQQRIPVVLGSETDAERQTSEEYG